MKTTRKTTKFQTRWETLLSTRQAAKKLGITPGYLYVLRARGAGPKSHSKGRFVRWATQDLSTWLASKN
jgi:predicted DNA-binding transcriptional regulator AlpA